MRVLAAADALWETQKVHTERNSAAASTLHLRHLIHETSTGDFSTLVALMRLAWKQSLAWPGKLARRG